MCVYISKPFLKFEFFPLLYVMFIQKVDIRTIRNELRFILLKVEFSICETLRKILRSSFSFSKVVSNNEAEALKTRTKNQYGCFLRFLEDNCIHQFSNLGKTFSLSFCITDDRVDALVIGIKVEDNLLV